MNKELPKRKRNRLEEFDYALNGAYFVTICVSGRHAMLWDSTAFQETPSKNEIRLSRYGEIIDQGIHDIELYYPQVAVDKYCIMPDHVHMILLFKPIADGRMISAPTLSTVVGQMKRWVSRQIGFSLWQKSFYDRIIRNEAEYQQIWKYIDENPVKIRMIGEHM